MNAFVGMLFLGWPSVCAEEPFQQTIDLDIEKRTTGAVAVLGLVTVPAKPRAHSRWTPGAHLISVRFSLVNILNGASSASLSPMLYSPALL